MPNPGSEDKLSQPALIGVLVRERVKVLAYIKSLVRDVHLAEDVFQDVCMLAVEKAATIHDEQHLMRWMRVSGRLLAMRALKMRNKGKLLFGDPLIELMESAWQKRDGDDMQERTDALRHCVELLPNRGRNLVEKRYFRRQSYEDLSAEMSRPVPSLQVAFSRIFTNLRSCMSARLRHIQGGTRG